MSLVIANNVSSITAQNNLTRSSTAMSRSLERLSSGFKINRGADGPAALVISEKQRAQIAGLNAAIDNTEKAVSMVQTAEGALTEINSLLVKIRSLSIDSANTAVNDEDALAANQAEIDNALSTIDRIAANTQFGTKKLLNGTAGFNAVSSSTFVTDLVATSDTDLGAFTIDAVSQDAQKGQVDVSNLGAAAALRLGNGVNLADDETLTITPVGGSAVNVNLTQGMTNTQVRDAINAVSNQTGVDASLESTNGNLVLTAKNFGDNFTVQSNLADAAGRTGIDDSLIETANDATSSLVEKEGQNLILDITDPDANTLSGVIAAGNVVTLTTGNFNGLSFTVSPTSGDAAVTQDVTNATITTGDSSLTFQIGANAGQTATLAIQKVSSDALGKDQPNNQFANLKAIDVTSAAGAQDALGVIDGAIDEISNLRGTLGAFQQNTLESTASNLRATLENTVNAESVIRDTDFAHEIAEFTKQQVLVQAGTSVLSSANQTPQLVLSLLG